MSNKLIIQYHIDKQYYPDFDKVSSIKKTKDYVEQYSKLSFELYCKKYHIDFIRVIEPKILHKHPTWERLDLWFDEDWFNKYDEICYTDTDVFALPWAQNIFNESDRLNCFKKAIYPKVTRYSIKQHEILNQQDHLLKQIDIKRVRDAGFQAGVWILTKYSRDMTMEYIQQYISAKPKEDSHLLNWAVMKSNVDVVNLPSYYNVKYSGVINENIIFLHAMGKRKNKDNTLYKQLKGLFGKC